MNNLENISTQTVILKNLLTNEKYLREVIPFIKPEYFEGVCKKIFSEVVDFVGKYNSLPTVESLKVKMDESDKINDNEYNEGVQLLPMLFTPENIDNTWLKDATEKWCQDRALNNAIYESINIIQGKNKVSGKDALPALLSDALSVSFDLNVGHDYIDNANERFDFYNSTEDWKLPFDIDLLNTITDGGLVRKSLNILLMGTGVGKSLAMCHFAAANILSGYNVLYITMEMSEEKIAERIDANLLDVNIKDVPNMTRQKFTSKIDAIKDKSKGSLVIKEYPTSQANTNHFRALLNELKLKKKFIPDVIYVDYLNICASSKIKGLSGGVNSYTYIKSIAEEMRGLAVEFNIPIMSATQVTRSGYGNSDIELTDTSESFGLPATCDVMLAGISSEELEEAGQLMFKQLKNRYNDINQHRRFVVGIDRPKMRLFNVGQDQQTLMSEPTQIDTPSFDKTRIGSRLANLEGIK